MPSTCNRRQLISNFFLISFSVWKLSHCCSRFLNFDVHIWACTNFWTSKTYKMVDFRHEDWLSGWIRKMLFVGGWDDLEIVDIQLRMRVFARAVLICRTEPELMHVCVSPFIGKSLISPSFFFHPLTFHRSTSHFECCYCSVSLVVIGPCLLSALVFKRHLNPLTLFGGMKRFSKCFS